MTVRRSSSPGDWDEWVARTSCKYDTRGERQIGDRQWWAEEFWPTESFTSLTRAAVRVRARDQYPTQVDLLVRVYRAGGGNDYPSLLLAEGRIPKLSVPPAYTWIEVALTTVDATPIAAGGHYWIVFRNDGYRERHLRRARRVRDGSRTAPATICPTITCSTARATTPAAAGTASSIAGKGSSGSTGCARRASWSR